VISLFDHPYYVDIPGECVGPRRVPRTVTTTRVVKNGRMYTMTWKDKISIEDPYLVMVKAAAYAIMTNEEYGATLPRRSYRDYLVKNSLTP
jgi:hypothetical protein